MAYYAALISLLKLLEEITHRDQYRNFLLHHKQQIESLHEKFSLLQASLEDYYSPKDIDEETADYLERRIRDAACQVQDIIEPQISNQISDQLQDLEKVKEEVEYIVEEVMRIKKTHTVEDLQLNDASYPVESGASKQASSGENTMVGFDEPLRRIKEQLCGDASKLQVISVAGMGGIGKTTSARKVFDDKLIVDRFDYYRVWITVSQDYHLRNILLHILDSINIISEELRKKDNIVLGEHIYKYLKGRRYLIIIDDMWETKVWDELRIIFPDDSERSRIVVTTRIKDVAFYVCDFGFFHQLPFLNKDQSWILFCENVFCPPELEDIGRLVANSCRGLPLAIVVVAGLLSKVNKTYYEWKKIARNVSSVATENDEHFSKILSLSYNHLPHHLKPCFLYMGGFPEDYQIPASNLINLWVAEGFPKPIESKSLEEIAEDYLEDLVSRNLILVTKNRFNGKFEHCRVHDVLRELCMKRASSENFLHILDGKNYLCPEIIGKVRRLYIHRSCPRFGEVEKHGLDGSSIRTILCFGNAGNDSEFLSFAVGSKLLRILDMSAGSFPHEILELYNLRYLTLRRIRHSNLVLPQSIYKLQNLQTLICAEGRFKEEFDISLLPHLRHVMVPDLELSPPLFAILENLQTLLKVLNVTFNNEDIEMIRNLQKLKVAYYWDTNQRWQKLGLNNLVRLDQLESLFISFPMLYLCPNPFPESFAFPRRLKKLTLDGCGVPWEDMTVVGSLSNLQELELRNEAFMGKEWEPKEGEFTQLISLKMMGLDFKYWRAEKTHLPRLKQLKITACWELEEIPLEIGDITTLELIEVEGSELAAKSAQRIQEEQSEQGNNGLELEIRVMSYHDDEASSDDEWGFEQQENEALESEEELKEEEGMEID